MATQSNLHEPVTNAIIQIDKRSNISRKELINEYVEPSIPVVLTESARGWKAMGKITPEFFKTNYAHLTKNIQGITYTLSDYVDLMLASTPERPVPYPFNFNVSRTCPELLDDLKPEILYAKSDRVNHPLLPKFMLKGTEVYEFFLGGNGASFPYLHVDALCLHTQITQLYGSKEFILYPPEQGKYMYPKDENGKVSQVDIFNPDYKKFPLFKHAKPVKVTIEQGETILFPTKWWHTTQIHEPCISLGRVQLNSTNWNDFVNDNHRSLKTHWPAMAVPVLIYAKTLGQLMTIQEKFS